MNWIDNLKKVKLWFLNLVGIRDVIFVLVGISIAMFLSYSIYKYEMYRSIKLGGFLCNNIVYDVKVRANQ